MKLKLMHVAIVAAGSTLSSGLYAQQSSSQQSSSQQQERSASIEEIIVTAQKRGEQVLQDIPATITALSEDFLKKQNVTDFSDFAYQVPGLTFQDEGAGEKRYTLRGIQSAGQQQVAVYYDEVPIPGVQGATSDSGAQTADLKIYDMQRVEVLKGPQGTTFGANSQTGTVRFITNKPDLEQFSATVGGQFSSTSEAGNNNTDLNLMLNLPLIEDELGVRFVLYDGEDAGYIDNVRLGQNDINHVSTTGIRTLVTWRPSDIFTLEGMIWLQDREVGGADYYHPFDTYNQNPGSSDQGHLDEVSPSTFFQTGDYQVGDYTQTPKPDNQKIYSLTGTWEFPWATLTATGSDYRRDFGFAFDSTWIILFLGAEGVRDDLVPALTDQDQSIEQKMFEVRINSSGDGPLQWLAGMFWRERESEFQSFVPVVDADTGLPFDPGTPFTGPSDEPGAGIAGCHPCVFARIADKNIEEQALFGEVSYDLTDNFQLTAGLRWFDVEQSDFGATLFQFALFGGDVPLPNTNASQQDELIQKYKISYRFEDSSLYALASQGFRLGGTNNQGIVAVPDLFEADEVWNYEIGYKSRWLDNRLTVNAAAFYVEFTNMQVAGRDPTDAFGFIGNAGSAEVKGLELEVNGRPSQNWDFSLGLSYIPTRELTEDQISSEIAAPGRKGQEIPHVPELTLNATAQRSFSLPVAGWSGFARAEYAYRDESNTQFDDSSPVNRLREEYDLVNLRLGFSSEQHDLDVTVFWENVFDEDGDVAIIQAAGEPTRKVTTRPSTIGIGLTKRFN